MSATTVNDKTEQYMYLFGGITSLVLGILLFTQTTAALAVVMLLIGLMWFIQGIFALLSIFIDKTKWGWRVFWGVIGIAAGLLVFSNPVASTDVVPAVVALILGVFGLIIGIAAVIGAFQGEGWGAGIFGVISIIIGLLLMFNSLVGGQVLVWLYALLLVIWGGVGIYWGLKGN